MFRLMGNTESLEEKNKARELRRMVMMIKPICPTVFGCNIFKKT